MPLGERATGTGFQIALECQRSCLVAKRDHDVEFPRPMLRRVHTFACVMRRQPHPNVGSDPGVVAISTAEAPQHVHETFWYHDETSGNVRAETDYKESQ